MTHLGGPMLGGWRSDGAPVWLRTLPSAKVEALVTTDEGEKRFGPVARTAASDLAAVAPVVEEHRIAGVLLISGDRHGASGRRIPRPSGRNFREFEVANLGPGGDHTKAAEKCPDQVLFCSGKAIPGNHVGEFAIDPVLPDPTATFHLVRPDGKSDYELVLKRSQPTPP